MIHHCVFYTFRDDVAESERHDIVTSLAGLVDAINGMIDLSFGPNADFEQKSPAYRHGFIARFEDRDALERYATDQRHIAVGQRLAANCVGGADGIIVFDMVES